MRPSPVIADEIRVILRDLQIIHLRRLVRHIHRGDSQRLALLGEDMVTDVQLAHRRPAVAFDEEGMLRSHAERLAPARGRVQAEMHDPRSRPPEEMRDRAQRVGAGEFVSRNQQLNEQFARRTSAQNRTASPNNSHKFRTLSNRTPGYTVVKCAISILHPFFPSDIIIRWTFGDINICRSGRSAPRRTPTY